jgi:DNA polymerase
MTSSKENHDYLVSALELQKDFGVEASFSKNISPLSFLKKDNIQSQANADQKTSKENVIKSQSEEKIDMKSKSKQDSVNQKIQDYKDSAGLSNSDWVNKARELANNAKNLQELQKTVENFDGLSIKKMANKCVFAEGNTNSEVMLIGEAPGANEDQEGRPFCGVSGQLLDKILGFAGYSRAENCYITNTVFWRPPGNRKPLPEEIEICKPFVEKHIELLDPKIIILVGGTATYTILNDKSSVSLLRKTVQYYHNPYSGKKIPCFAVYHPSYLLRQPSQKKNMWFDLLKIKKFIASN